MVDSICSLLLMLFWKKLVRFRFRLSLFFLAFYSVWLSLVHCMFNFDDIQSEYFFKHWHSEACDTDLNSGHEWNVFVYNIEMGRLRIAKLLAVYTNLKVSHDIYTHLKTMLFLRPPSSLLLFLLDWCYCCSFVCIIKFSLEIHKERFCVYHVLNFCLRSTVCSVHLIVSNWSDYSSGLTATAVNIFTVQ